MQQQLDSATSAISKAKVQIRTSESMIEKCKSSLEEIDKKLEEMATWEKELRTKKQELEIVGKDTQQKITQIKKQKQSMLEQHKTVQKNFAEKVSDNTVNSG
jgi:chromosome segregation ATPase